MLVTTTKGDMDDSRLVRRDTKFENENERTTAVEYWLPLGHGTPISGTLCYGDGNGDGVRYEVFGGFLCELVHRAVHVTLKRVPDHGTGEVGGLT